MSISCHCSIDVYVLAEVFQNYRKVIRKLVDLDPIHYLSSPSLSMDAFLSVTKEKLDLITDVEIYRLMELSLRGGLAFTSCRHGVATDTRSILYTDGK